MIQLIAFYLFATITIASAAMVIFARNPVHSVMWLILAFFNAAGLMLLAGAEFIAMLLVIVYVGALVAIILAAELVFAVGAWQAGGVDLASRAAPAVTEKSNIQQIGELLYTRYIFLFEAAGIVLLVAMIGAIVLTHRQRSGVRPQNVSRQVARRPQDAVRNVDAPVGQGVEL